MKQREKKEEENSLWIEAGCLDGAAGGRVRRNRKRRGWPRIQFVSRKHYTGLNDKSRPTWTRRARGKSECAKIKTNFNLVGGVGSSGISEFGPDTAGMVPAPGAGGGGTKRARKKQQQDLLL